MFTAICFEGGAQFDVDVSGHVNSGVDNLQLHIEARERFGNSTSSDHSFTC